MVQHKHYSPLYVFVFKKKGDLYVNSFNLNALLIQKANLGAVWL